VQRPGGTGIGDGNGPKRAALGDGLATRSARNPAQGWAAHASALHHAIVRYASGSARTRLDLALKAIADGQFDAAIGHGREALKLDPRCSIAWRLIALAHEGQGDGAAALDAYQSAYAIDPGSTEILTDLGRLAVSLGLSQVAVELFARALAAQPGSTLLATQLSMALRDGHEYGLAISVMRDAILIDPRNAHLWNALATVLLQQGDTGNALTMVEEALSLSSGWTEALYNRAIARLELGDLDGAKADCDAASPRAKAAEKPAIHFVRAQVRLAAGDLAAGWTDYSARLHPSFAKAPAFDLPGRPWRTPDRLDGARLLVAGEQGLGDEMMFASMIPDLLSALGPAGRLVLAVAPRLTALFQRSFPLAEVHAHEMRDVNGRATVSAPGVANVELWAPMGALARRFRAATGAFDGQAAYLLPAPDAAARWKATLDGLGPLPKVGLAWKSKKTHGHRLKQYAPFADWAPVLQTPGLSFVNLQYGDCDEELAAARALGVEIWSPPGLDLTNDIDGAAALSSVVDLVIGVGNASTNLAAATGTPTWFVCGPAAWPTLGTGRHPWFPTTRVFAATRFGEWAPVMQAVVGELAQTYAGLSA